MFKICSVCKKEQSIENFFHHRHQCKKCYREKRRVWRIDNPNYRYIKLASRSKKKNLSLVGKDEFVAWFNSEPKVCHYCECSEKDQKNDKTHSKNCLEIDRKDSNQGYTLDNIVLACSQCNLAKAHFWDYDTFKTYIAPAIKLARKSISK